MLQAKANIYNHLNDLINIVKDKNENRWKKTNGILQDIFFQGLLDVIDRATMEAYKNMRMEEESGAVENTKKITGKTKKYIKYLADGLFNLTNKEKDDLFNMKMYGKGSTARNAVTAILVDKFLSKKFKVLKYDKDDEYLRLFNSKTLEPNEIRKILKHNKYLESQIKEIDSKGFPKKRKSRPDAGLKYHGLLKDIVHLMFQKEEHYDVDYWDTLVMPGFWKSGNVWDSVITRINEEKAKAGANALG